MHSLIATIRTLPSTAVQDFKHRVFSEPNDICTECGASPQDVSHLFACNTHPTDLHLRIYGGIRWDRFVRSATSTTETSTDLTTDLVVANNNNSQLEPY